MSSLLIFALVLFAAVLASRLAASTAASVSVLFIVAGMLLGKGGMGWIPLAAGDSQVQHLATAALVAVLFTDGMRAGVREVRKAWHLPGRALLFGLPLTLLILATLAHYLTGLPWLLALLLAAILTPTDPVFAAAIVGRDEVHPPLRRLLNVESGINDGLTLPVVLVLMGMLGADEEPLPALLLDVAAGAVIGLTIPWIAGKIRPRRLRLAEQAEPLYGLSLAIATFALAGLLGANEFLAAFFAGATFASVDEDLAARFHLFAEQLSELLKLAALLTFGALMSPSSLFSLEPAEYAFCAAALLIARPFGLLPALVGSKLDMRHRLAAAWFGPKGFASLIYAIMVLHSEVPEAGRLFHIAAVVVVLSIVAHSSSDVPLARWLNNPNPAKDEPGPAKGEPSQGGKESA
ncbi:MAG: cation:proton antiporter [Burkholderiaceae bacterium]